MMPSSLSRRTWLCGSAVSVASLLLPPQGVSQSSLSSAPRTFELQFPESLRQTAYTGRVYVFLSRQQREPRLGPNWFQPEPMLARDVVDLRPGDVVSLSSNDPDVLTFPRDLSKVDLSQYWVQGMMRFNTWERSVGTGAGNAFGRVLEGPAPGKSLSLVMESTVPALSDRESRWSRPFPVASKLLSDFHGRPVSILSQVTLPSRWYDAPKERFPVIFHVPGFTGTYRKGYHEHPVPEHNSLGVEFIRVVIDPECPLGHHVFADSVNNGPWSRALVEEFLPALEAEFRTLAEPRGRLLTGHSSGGWSTLWLQTQHPDVFGGTWSTAPDPVDFRDFQRINLYAPGENMYRTTTGERRPLARQGDRVLLWYEDFCRMEDVLGHGGQLHSFEAVFGPKGEDGTPQRLWDRETGVIDTATAETWKAYDIRRQLQERWSELAPRLRGKLNVHMGDLDTFYLEGATRLMQKTLSELGSDAVVEMHADKDHSSIMTRELRQRIHQEMAQSVTRS